MIGTYSVINIYDGARDEGFCKICGCYCDNEDKIIIFTKTKTTEFYLPKLAWDQIEYPINIEVKEEENQEEEEGMIEKKKI